MRIPLLRPDPASRPSVWLVLGLLLGLAGATGWEALRDRSDLMSGKSRRGRIARLYEVVRSVGGVQLSTCEAKVARLHREIARGDIVGPDGYPGNREIGRTAAAILIDGADCTDALLRHLDCRTPIPDANFYPGFVLVGIQAEELRLIAKDEQALVLWMLDRIHPERHLNYPPWRSEDEILREILVLHWKDGPWP